MMIPLAALTGKVWTNENNIPKRKLYFPRDNSNILSDSPTWSKESMRLVLNIIASSKWLCWSTDTKQRFYKTKI